MAQSFRDLKVWQLAMELTMLIYAITSEFPKHEMFALTSQMRRAAISIPSNLAEGSARRTKKGFRQFVGVARGSHAELQTQMILANRLGYIKDEKFCRVEAVAEEVGRMLQGWSRSLEAAPSSDSKPLRPNTYN